MNFVTITSKQSLNIYILRCKANTSFASHYNIQVLFIAYPLQVLPREPSETFYFDTHFLHRNDFTQVTRVEHKDSLARMGQSWVWSVIDKAACIQDRWQHPPDSLCCSQRYEAGRIRAHPCSSCLTFLLQAA